MSNRVDYYQGIETELAIPASRPVVFLDGSLCPYLLANRIVRDMYPEFSYAEIVYDPGAFEENERILPESIETIAGMGRKISIRQFYKAKEQRKPSAISVFEGRIEKIDTTIGSTAETVTITARDFSALLERTTVHGARVDTGNGDTLRLEGTETIFNADGEPNASKQILQHEGKAYKIFAKEQRYGKFWSCAEAVHYLLNEYIIRGQLQVPGTAQLEAVFGEQTLDETDVEGLPVIKALQKCCEQAQVAFKFEPRLSETGPRERIVFYRAGRGKKVELNLQYAGESLSISKTNIAGIKSERQYWPVTDKFIVQGDLKRFEATFNLIKAWDPALEGQASDKYSPSTNEDFETVKDVYRKWCLNEAGDYTGAPFDQGEAFDFSYIFLTPNYIRHRRVFEKALSTDSAGESLGYYLEVSFNNGSTWQEYTDGFDVLSDECGVWLSDDELSTEVWTAITAESLKFRMTATVQSDERTSFAVSNGPVNSVVQVTKHIETLASRFKFDKVSPKSIFENSADHSVPLEIDNTLALVEYTRNLADNQQRIIESIQVTTPMLAMHYRLGDRVVAGPDSRDVLGISSDSRSIFWIERVNIDIAKQSTKLKILRRRD